MKKKILTLALVVAVIAIVVSSSLAYFTAEDKVTNTFTIGSVLIDIFENDQITDKDTIEFDEPMLPVVDKANLASDPGYFEKEIKVQSNGENAAYIRTLIAIPKNLVGYLVLDLNTTGDWAHVSTFEVVAEDNVRYTVYAYDYAEAVDPKKFTTNLLKGVYLDSSVDIKDNPDTPTADLEFCKPKTDGSYEFSGFTAHSKVTDGYKSVTVNVLVAAQAIQAQGFDTTVTKPATAALNTGFPIGTNPWGTAANVTP